MYKKILLTFLMVIFLSLPEPSNAALIDATGLVGQTDLNGNPVYTTNIIHNNKGGPTAVGFGVSNGSTLDPINHRLFVGDSTNSRILVFSLDNNNHLISTTATYVLGQPNFTATGTRLTQNGLSTFLPSFKYDSTNNRLFVLDQNYHRVLVYELDSISNGMNASYVIGQPNFTTGSFGVTQSKLKYPDGVAYDPVNNRLFISDLHSHRVLVYSVPPNTNLTGINADYVIGQTDFTTGTFGTTRSKLYYGAGLAYDPVNNRLFVNDYYNNRVMIFSVPLSTNLTGINADYVIGQTDFTTNTPGTAQNKLRNPDDILGYDSQNNRLFVSDNGNIRVMVFIVPPGVDLNGISAQNVIGQSNYTSSTTGISQNRFIHPNGTDSFDPINNRLFLKDRTNYRVMEFSMIKIATSALFAGVVENNFSQTISLSAARGDSQSFSLYNGSLPDGLNLDSSTGSIYGIPTTSGTFSFTVQASDNFSTGLFFDRFQYTLDIINRIQTATTTTDTATLSWNAPSDGGSPITDYLVEYKPSSSMSWSTFAHTPTNATSISITGLARATSYDFRVSAVNALGTGQASNTYTAITRRGGGYILPRLNTTLVIEDITPPSNTVVTPAAITETVKCEPSTILTQNLKPGARDGVYNSFTKEKAKEVKILQAHMNRLGYGAGKEDGILGPITKGSIMRMQKFLGTTQDGAVGPLTREKINNSCEKGR